MEQTKVEGYAVMEIFLLFGAFLLLFLFIAYSCAIFLKIRYVNHKHIETDDLQNWPQFPISIILRENEGSDCCRVTLSDYNRNQVTYTSSKGQGILREIIEMDFPSRFGLKLVLVGGHMVRMQRQFQQHVDQPTFPTDVEKIVFAFITRVRANVAVFP